MRLASAADLDAPSFQLRQHIGDLHLFGAGIGVEIHRLVDGGGIRDLRHDLAQASDGGLQCLGGGHSVMQTGFGDVRTFRYIQIGRIECANGVDAFDLGGIGELLPSATLGQFSG